MESTEGLFWGVDIGGTSAKVGCFRNQGFVMAETVETGRDSSPSEVIEKVSRVILKADPAPAGAGIGAAGLIDRSSGTVVTSPNLPLWRGAAVAGLLSRLLNAPVVLDNDCNAFAYGAICSGEIPPRGLWLFLTFGTGIGGTIINDGQILYGTGASGEFGHMSVDNPGLACSCGSSGCWELYSGRAALLWHYRKRTGRSATPLEISALASAGDCAAREAFRDFGYWVGVGLANLANCFAPCGFFVGGGLSATLCHFGVTARRVYLDRCSHPWSLTLLEDSPEAGAHGACCMARNSCF